MKDTDKKKLEQQAEIAIADYIRKVPDRVETILDLAVCAALGVKRDFGDFRIAEAYGKQLPLILELVQNKCRPAAEAVIAPLVDAALAKIRMDSNKIAAIAERVTSTYYRVLEDKCVELARKRAEVEAEAVISGAAEVDLTGIFPNLETEDPEAYKTKLGEILLEEIARRMSAGQAVKVVRKHRSIVMEDVEDE